MVDIKKWALPETTKKAIFEGIYPVVISMSKAFTKEVERDDKKIQREVVSLTFTTLTDVPFPDKTNGKLIVEQQYYFDVSFHVNALNGIARAAGISKLTDTDELEGKTVMIGIINETFMNRDDEEVTVAKFGSGLFSYAPMSEKSEIKFMANDFPNGNISEDDRKEWFKDNIKLFKEPK